MNKIIKTLEAISNTLETIADDVPEEHQGDVDTARDELDEVIFYLIQIRAQAECTNTEEGQTIWKLMQIAMSPDSPDVATVCDEAAKLIAFQRVHIKELKANV